MPPTAPPFFDNSRWAEFEPRPGDVFVCTPPKCGTTWTRTIIANLFWPDGNLPGPVMQLSPRIEALFMSADGIRRFRTRSTSSSHATGTTRSCRGSTTWTGWSSPRWGRACSWSTATT